MIIHHPYQYFMEALIRTSMRGCYTVAHIGPSDVQKSNGYALSDFCVDELNHEVLKIINTTPRSRELCTVLASSNLLATSPPIKLGHSTKKGRNKKQIARNRKRNKNKKTHRK